MPIPSEIVVERFSVLIAVGQDDTATLLTNFFGGLGGYDTVSTSDGLTALIELGRLKPDLMILDIEVSQVDGLDVCRRIKSDGANKTTIIAISNQTELEPQIRQAGADAFLTKPLDLDKLLIESKRLLQIL
jgi:CheY-like chemotaxis protein